MEHILKTEEAPIQKQQDQTLRPKIVLRCSRPRMMDEKSSTGLEKIPLTPIPEAIINSPRLRCDPDPFHPGLAQCTAEVDDDRQGISHFFGRNKKSTASIPQSCFPLMCRVHYQEKGYRWGKNCPGVFADFQCGCIVKTLEAMSRLTFTDEHENVWPWFCGLTLQVPMPKGRRTTMSKPSNKDKSDNQTPVHGDRDSSVSLETQDKYEASLHNMPDWLRDLVTKHPLDTRYEVTEHPNGVQYNIPQVIAIVRAIGKYCIDNEVKLPKIEAIPATLGMHFEQELDKIKKNVRDLTIKRDRATTKLRNAVSKAARDIAGEELELADDALALVEDDLYLAQLDFETTSHMVPATRITKRKAPTDKLVQPRLRNKNMSDSLSSARENADIPSWDSKEKNPPHDNDEGELVDGTDEDMLTGMREVLEEAETTSKAQGINIDIDMDELEEGEILEESDAESVSTQFSSNQIDVQSSSSDKASRTSPGKKRKLKRMDSRAKSGSSVKRPRWSM